MKRRLTIRRWSISIGLLALLFAGFAACCVMVGSVPWERVDSTILRVRMIRVGAAGVVGFALAAAGVVFQAILRNPLADPFILGVSGGGALGAALGIVLGIGSLAAWPVTPVPLFAFLGSLGAVAIVYSLSLTGRSASTYVLLLVGVVCNALFSALIMLLMSLAPAEELQRITAMLMGTISETSVLPHELMLVTGLVLVGGVILAGLSRRLNMMCMGEETAERLGVNVPRTRKLCFVLASLITGAAVSISGLIGFVGLIVPHAMRLLLGPDHRLLLPASALGGAIFLMFADGVVRVSFPIWNSQLPVGVITALCGGPFFIFLLHRKSVRTLGG